MKFNRISFSSEKRALFTIAEIPHCQFVQSTEFSTDKAATNQRRVDRKCYFTLIGRHVYESRFSVKTYDNNSTGTALCGSLCSVHLLLMCQ